MLQRVSISLLGKNEIAREGLRKILSSENFQVRDSVSDVSVLLKSLDRVATDGESHVVLVDYWHHSESVEACRSLAKAKGDAHLVLLADHYAFQDVAEAFHAGVDGVIIKEIFCEPLIESIRLVALGEKVFPSQLVHNLTSCMPAADAGDWKLAAVSVGLSSREIEILESIMDGQANKVIARKFNICEATVKVHVKAILRKLGVGNRTQAATWAVKHGVGTAVQLPLKDAKSGNPGADVLPILERAA